MRKPSLRRKRRSPRATPYLSHVDSPRWADPPAHSVLVAGWVAVPPGAEREGPFLDAGERRPLELVPRPEVESGFGDWQVTGFRTIVPITPDTAGDRWSLVVRVNGEEFREPLPVEPSTSALTEFRAIKQAKLARIEPLLRCPRPAGGDAGGADCLGELTRADEAHLECTRCGAQYERAEQHFDLLPADLAAQSGIEHTDNISSWGYDPIAAGIIRDVDGLVLDAGSGFKSTVFENVVNLEIVSYPSTDVLGVGERLPFATGAFDAALSLNVLEHVRDPFRCASELSRVVRPGGRLYAAVPFLQPYHGYPHHYYNMTASGLMNLFEGAFEVEELKAPASGVPIWALSWFLNSYVAGLPGDVAERFRHLTVEELMAPAEQFLERDFVTELRASTNIELACNCVLVGTRRRA
ncbi:MAG TPA: methyltransferase domain-containing protein [Acidimicrobiia bacterium]|nr:methyltransferase domain-containing protein [Acidimicrobiia bacterium]